jgi:hypothetical protein
VAAPPAATRTTTTVARRAPVKARTERIATTRTQREFEPSPAVSSAPAPKAKPAGGGEFGP